MKDKITLKWGTLKSWNVSTPDVLDLIKKYIDLETCGSAMYQNDTPEQKRLICEIIDKSNCSSIYLDWDSTYVSKDKAKKYVMKFSQ